VKLENDDDIMSASMGVKYEPDHEDERLVGELKIELDGSAYSDEALAAGHDDEPKITATLTVGEEEDGEFEGSTLVMEKRQAVLAVGELEEGGEAGSLGDGGAEFEGSAILVEKRQMTLAVGTFREGGTEVSSLDADEEWFEGSSIQMSDDEIDIQAEEDVTITSLATTSRSMPMTTSRSTPMTTSPSTPRMRSTSTPTKTSPSAPGMTT